MLLNDNLNDNDDIMKQMRGLYARANSVFSLLPALLKSNLDYQGISSFLHKFILCPSVV